jgi:uncharacterized protein
VPVLLNLTQLASEVLTLEGTLPAAELDWGGPDDLVTVGGPLAYHFTVRKQGVALLLHGTLAVELDCRCARCLKSFRRRLELSPWSAELALTGEDAPPVIGEVVDLTPCLREDTVLALPQHPLCEPECGGLPSPPRSGGGQSGATPAGEESAWSALDQLKF